MKNESSNILIDEEELQASDQISLYKELIRILEKDINDIQTRSTRDGWTTWGILGAIVGSVLLLLGQTKDLKEIPSEIGIIAATFLVLFQFVFAAYNFLTGNKYLVKERRLISSKEVFRGRGFLFAVRFIILLGISVVIYFTAYPEWIKTISIISLFIPVIYVALTIFLTSYNQQPFGNNPKYRKFTMIWGYFFLFCNLLAIFLLGYQLKFPIGQPLTSAYVIGLSFSAIIFLVEVLLATSTPSETIVDLEDLKGDVIFRRIDLNEALNRYKILKEGKSLYDEMKDDFDRIMGYLYREEEIYNEQKRIINKMSELIPQKNESEKTVKDKNEQINILSNSFTTYGRELSGLVTLTTSELTPFQQKLRKSAEACGDYEAENVMNSLIVQKLNELVEKEKEINKDRNSLLERAKKLGSDNSRGSLSSKNTQKSNSPLIENE